MSITTKTLTCAKCGQEIVIKSFQLASYKHTADGIICKACANGETAAPEAEEPAAPEAAEEPVAEEAEETAEEAAE